MKVLEFDSENSFFYENGFYLTSNISRTGKLLAHYEIYKMINNLPGDILEFGVFKGASLLRWATFRELFENTDSRKVIGFDTFGEFPESFYEEDKSFRDKFIQSAGHSSIKEEELNEVFSHKQLVNIELVKGDILKTVPEWKEKNPGSRISLMHIDTDIYEPAKLILDELYERVVKGGVILVDDYTSFPGETQAVDEFIEKHGLRINKFPFSHGIPSYIIKP